MKTSLATTVLSAALGLGAMTAGTGCRPAMVPLTQELREQNRLTDGELRNLQYYVSHTITLRREAESGGREVTGNHKLVVVAGKKIEEVVIEARTPGICVQVGAHALEVSFEQGTSLRFAPATSRYASSPEGFASPPEADPFPGNAGHVGNAPPPRADGVFSGGYVISMTPSSTVTFLGKSFDAVEDTGEAGLLIDAESLEQVVKQRKVLPGLVLQNR